MPIEVDPNDPLRLEAGWDDYSDGSPYEEPLVDEDRVEDRDEEYKRG